MEAKVEHLKLVQAAISRMGSNSFLLKGWTVTLVAALFAFAAKDADRGFLIIAWVPLVVFGLLDTYYLWQERLFRELYRIVAAKPDADAVDFSMDIEPIKAIKRWPGSFASASIWGFYGPLTLLLLILTVYVALNPYIAPVPVQGPKTITISIQ